MKKNIRLYLLLIMLVIFSSVTIAAEYYTVKTGDTLWTISQKTGIAIENITANNNLNNPNNIYVGQKLIIKNNNSNNNSNNSNGYVSYTVKSGDLLWKIAQKYNITIQEIIDLNNISSPYYIYIGQSLLLPAQTEPAAGQGTSYFYYTVKAGDILWNISQKYGTTVQKLVELNNIKNSYDLYAGRKLIIPLQEVQPDNNDNNNDSGNDNNDNDSNSDNNNDNSNFVPYTFYTVRDGDQIWDIAENFAVKTSTLINYNNLENIKELQTGEVLIIPLENSTKFSYLRKSSKLINNYYRVLASDTIADIAGYYNIPEEGIRAINRLTADENIYTGQKLLMPVNPALFKKHKIYKVKAGGEYLFNIAYDNGISIKSILKANYLQDQNTKFKAGTVILVPLDENSKATWIDYEDGKPVNSWF